MRKSLIGGVAIVISAALPLSALAAESRGERQSVEELRNTVVNLLDGLVQKGVLTREQAQAMVADAQAKAAAQAQQDAARETAEAGAVRVPYVPEIVKEAIGRQVEEQLRPVVTQDVIAKAREEKWGIPAALPDWISRIRFSGDMRFRAQGDMFADDNLLNSYVDYSTVNARGGVSKAGLAAYLNTTEDQQRERIRLRLAMEAALGGGWTAGLRLASGSLGDPVSTNQTLGQTGQRYQFAVDQAWLRYQTAESPEKSWFAASAGRFSNPYLSTDLVWDPDLMFEGVATTFRYRPVYLTMGAFPIQNVGFTSSNKWLYGGQLGLNWSWSEHGAVKIGAGEYYFSHISGKRNAADSNLLDYTAPAFMQKGNSVFDIRNDTDPTTNLYALAAQFHLLDATASIELPVLGHSLFLTADYVKNIGYKVNDVLARVGYASLDDVPEAQRILFARQADGYQVEFGAGTHRTGVAGAWRASLAYRHLERDAVPDAFTDSDFHLGGTAAKGFVLKGEWWFRDRVSLAARYYAADAIVNSERLSNSVLATDAPPFGVDTIMIDLNGFF